jgi:hypothetical protein
MLSRKRPNNNYQMLLNFNILSKTYRDRRKKINKIFNVFTRVEYDNNNNIKKHTNRRMEKLYQYKYYKR